MGADDLRPPARAARRTRLRESFWLTVAAVVAGVFVAITLPAVIRNCDEDPDCPRPGPYPAFLVVFPPIALWYAVSGVRAARLFAKPGRRHELRSVVARRRKRRWVLYLWPRMETVTHTWLVATSPSGDDVAIPVEEGDANRCAPATAALVRGELRPGRRVVLDFPDTVIWPTGRVEAAPPDAGPVEPPERPAPG